MAKFLTAEEEIALARVIRGSSSPAERRQARNELVVRNMPFAKRAAGRYAELPDYDDICSEAYCGLLEAASRYDPDEHGARFTTYASHWIRMKIRNHFRRQPQIHVPFYLQNPHSAFYHRSAGRRNGDRRRQRIIAQAAQARGVYLRVDSLGDNEAAVDPMDYRPVIDEDTGKVTLSAEIVQAMESLTPLEHEVIVRRYGLDGGSGATLAAIGEALGFTREYIRILQKRALAKLRERVSECA